MTGWEKGDVVNGAGDTEVQREMTIASKRKWDRRGRRADDM